MKAKLIFSISILLLFIASISLAEDHKKEIPVEEALEAFCGTWIKDGSYGTEKDIWNNNGTYEWYWKKTDTEPRIRGTFKIEKSWMDHEGNVWFIVWTSFRGGSRTLTKVSNSGMLLELVRYSSGQSPPSKIDPDDKSYRYYRYIRNKIK